MSGLITAEWLESVGFKWHQLDRQPDRHWLLWLGRAAATRGFMVSTDDIGIELAPLGRDDAWFCWFRSDAAGRYHRFIHVRHLAAVSDLIALVEAITGQPWDPNNHFYGSVLSPEEADRAREEAERLDRKIMRSAPWADIERDDSRGRALPEHLEAHEEPAP